MSERRTAQDLVQVLMQLEPVRQSTKDEEEHGQSKQEETSHDTRGIPNLTSNRRDEIVLGEAVQKRLLC